MGNNLYPGRDMIKVFNITFGALVGGETFGWIWFLSVMIMENTGLLDTKISNKIFSNNTKKK